MTGTEVIRGIRLCCRALWLGVPLLLTACASSPPQYAGKDIDPTIVAMYARPKEEPFRVASVDLSKIDPQYLRQTVPVPNGIPNQPGTIVVDPTNRFLYLIQSGGTALRYGIGVGRDGFAWAGTAQVGDKSPWPRWNPTPEHQARDQFAARYPRGMDGGPRNPIGARALYIWQGQKDTLYRIHGTSDNASIGQAVSSGCVRLFNQDIIDLYDRVEIGAKVVVLPSPNAPIYKDGVPVPPPAVAATPTGNAKPI